MRFFPFVALMLISTWLSAQEGNPCDKISVPGADFEVRTDFAKVAIKWYPEWLELNDGKRVYPDPLESLEKWEHPQLNNTYPSSM